MMMMKIDYWYRLYCIVDWHTLEWSPVEKSIWVDPTAPVVMREAKLVENVDAEVSVEYIPYDPVPVRSSLNKVMISLIPISKNMKLKTRTWLDAKLFLAWHDGPEPSFRLGSHWDNLTQELFIGSSKNEQQSDCKQSADVWHWDPVHPVAQVHVLYDVQLPPFRHPEVQTAIMSDHQNDDESNKSLV